MKASIRKTCALRDGGMGHVPESQGTAHFPTSRAFSVGFPAWRHVDEVGLVVGPCIVQIQAEREPPEKVVCQAEDDCGKRPDPTKDQDCETDWTEDLAGQS